LGFNYYWNCQWEIGTGSLPWPDEQGKRKKLSALLLHCYSRFGLPMFISETGHVGSGRAEWFEEIAHECITAIDLGVDLRGICLYPIVDRPDWDNLSFIHESGLFDLNRQPDLPFLSSLKKYYPLLRQTFMGTAISTPVFR
jgi:beta-glucosidase/6-phospho-beta-glucosidase/beta-galactosidase